MPRQPPQWKLPWIVRGSPGRWTNFSSPAAWFPYLNTVYSLVGQSFDVLGSVQLAKEEDAETREQWIEIGVTVRGETAQVLDAYDRFTDRWLNSVPDFVRESFRLAYRLADAFPSAMSEASTQVPKTRPLRLLLFAAAVLLAFAVTWLAWSQAASRRLQARVQGIMGRHEPIYPQDFAVAPVPKAENAATYLQAATAAMSGTARPPVRLGIR